MKAPDTTCIRMTEGYEHNWWGVVTHDYDEEGVEYIRADLIPAMLAAEREKALREAVEEISSSRVFRFDPAWVKGKILSLIPKGGDAL